MRELYQNFKIRHHILSPHYPQKNGQVETTSKILIRVLERIIEIDRNY